MSIYLDNAATTFPKPESVYLEMDRFARRVGGLAGRGGHTRASQGAQVLSDLRLAIGELVGCNDPDRIVLTKNATEAINLVIFGVLQPGDAVVCTVADHNAVLRPIRQAEQALGVAVTRVGCDRHGRLDMAAMASAIGQKPKLVVTSHAGNVTGALHDIHRIATLCKTSGSLFCLDAAQSAGLAPIDMSIGIDFVALTGHKSLFGPTGTGALALSERGADLAGRIFGGTGSQSEQDRQPDFLPDRLEAGTLNTFGFAGLLAGIRFVHETGLEAIHAREAALRRELVERLCAIDRLTLFGSDDGPTTPAIGFVDQRLNPADIAFLLDRKYDIQVRPGLHCAPLLHRALGTFPEGAVRLSPGYFTTEQQIETAINAIQEILEHG